ncbi:MAG: N-acetylglucosamine-6-phosphate deacetylase [Anaerolineae bacterium]|nr:N-acetylglucosamine-6-phosphate deacetylase [Anaerolineae bacterium]
MLTSYPWPASPEREQLVVRLRPGDDQSDVTVLEWAGERFVGARPADRSERTLVAADPMVFASPGLFDTQINGYLGRGFKDADLGPDGIRDLCWSILLSGTTRFLPTVTTDAPEVMEAAMCSVHAACRIYPDVAAVVSGIHQEGPWLSPVDGPRGAHPRQHISLPDPGQFDRLQQAAGGRIALLTLAPEVDGAIDLIRFVSSRGIAVCLGHHDADAETIHRAVAAGARGVTHLGNGCHTTMPRHPNVLWEQAAEDRLYAGIIADGHHLPPSTIKVLYRAKPRDRLILVSDAVDMAGAMAGLYHVRGAIAELTPEGRFGFYRSPTLIGAAVPLARCLANLVAFADEGKTPVAYLPAVTDVPSALIGEAGTCLPLGRPGTPATFVIWRWERDDPSLVPQRIVVLGRTVYDIETQPTTVPFGRTPQIAAQEEADQWRESRP